MSYKEVVESEAVGDVTDLFKSIKDAYADKVKVRVETTLMDETITPLKDDKTGKTAGFFSKLLRPKVTVMDPNNNTIYTTAPYGDPAEIRTSVKTGFVAALAGIFGGVFLAGRASKK